MEDAVSLTGRWEAPAPDGAGLRFLYHTPPGRALLKLLSARGLSRLAGRLLDSRLSRPLIGPFVRRHGVRLSDYREADYACFNDFFCREIRPELRPLPADPALLIAPCDGRLSARRLDGDTVLTLKLLGGDPAAARYRDGVCLVFRLCVDDYHRYCYPDDGAIVRRRFLPGVLHTVRPIALDKYPVFFRNCREYTVMDTARFGLVTQMEVGALLVGKIENRRGAGAFTRGEEKGLFRYGGSTVILLLEKGRAELPDELFRRSAEGLELRVRQGQPIGRAAAYFNEKDGAHERSESEDP